MQLFCWAARGIDGVVDGRDGVLDRRQADSGQQIVLAAEMGVDEWLGNAQLGRDIIERRAGKTTGVKQRDRLLQDPFPLIGDDFVTHAVDPIFSTGG